jgi:hypothetical protein
LVLWCAAIDRSIGPGGGMRREKKGKSSVHHKNDDPQVVLMAVPLPRTAMPPRGGGIDGAVLKDVVPQRVWPTS